MALSGALSDIQISPDVGQEWPSSYTLLRMEAEMEALQLDSST